MIIGNGLKKEIRGNRYTQNNPSTFLRWRAILTKIKTTNMELKLTISASQEVLDAINNLANALQGRVIENVKAEEVVTEKPKKVTKEKVQEEPKKADSAITIETIRAKVQEVAQSKRTEVKELLGEFKVSRVSDLQEADFTDFMNALIKL